LRPRIASVAVGGRGSALAHAPQLALLGALLCVASVAQAVAGASSDAAFGRGLLQLLIVAVPIAVGLYALRAPGNAPFGIAPLGIGFAWSLTALAQSSASVPHTIGRLATWLTFPCVVYLLLAFPDGRIAKGLDRVVFFGIVGVMLFLFYGTAPFVAAFPPKTLWATCSTDCPPNAIFVLDRQPAFMTQVILVREWLIELLWLGLFVSLFRRWRAASPLQQRAMGPAFVAGALLGVTHLTHITTRQLGAPTDTVVAISSVWMFCIVAVCAAFVFGLLRRRMLLAAALARLGVAQRVSDDPSELRDVLATALSDTTTELLFRDPAAGAWHDARGRPVSWPQDLPRGRAATTIGDDDAHVAVLIHDVALCDDPELLEGVSGMVLAGWRHRRLLTDLGNAMRDLEDSRRRIAEAADLERARIERDLHDGAQQRLIALRIRLGLAEEKLKREPAAGIEDVRELGFEAELAVEELRSLAHGIYPSLLTDRGVPDALRSVAQHAPLPVHVAAHGVTRQPSKIESAVYFTCVEAIQNAIKHASGATAVWTTLTQSPGALRFEVHDDGPGFKPGACDGRGLRNMRDRTEAVGGHLTFDAPPGRGARVRGSVDLAVDAP
jgi:signal transduction histidine kinase